VVDIGGGSTEFSIGASGKYINSASVPLGAVTLTEAHFTTDPPRPEDLTNAIGEMSDEVEDLTRTIPELGRITNVVGVGGTIVTVAAVELGLAEFSEEAIHGFVLTRDAAEDVFRTLATEPMEARVLNPGLPRDRADIIVAGCCLLVGIMRRLSLNEITVSTHGLVNGVAARDRLNR
jgi:exopolyphosphatase/guanosine-5'-triphosphate,3'-diphosphate pyrophosphatase